MLAQRVATALIGVPAILALIAWGGTLAFSIALGAVLAAAVLEFFAATDPAPSGRSRILAPRPPALLGVAAVALLVAAAHNGTDWSSGALALAIALIFGLLILQGDTGAGLRDWMWATGGVVYVGFLGSHLVLLRHLEDGRDWVLLAILAIWATDTAAYFVGRTLGRIHLTPNISPRKTLEGSLAGLIGGFGSVLLINWLIGPNVDLADILPIALLLPLVAQIGDLAESLIKRSAGVKDTGAIFPGHGGFLDRLDSILFAAPLVYYLVIWVIL
ncbi:MAG: phosphatidate cytidylyltransferase [Dehalococcoidia bacterium]